MRDTDARYRICTGYVLRKVFDDYLAIPVASPQGNGSSVAILNPVAEFIWRQIEGEGKTFQQLLEAVLDEFVVDEQTAASDITDFLDHLRINHYLIEEKEDT